MKKLISLCFLLFISVQLFSQKPEIKIHKISSKDTTMIYSFHVDGLNVPATSYKWVWSNPPRYRNEHCVFSEKDSITVYFNYPGIVTMTVSYMDKNKKWSEELYKNFEVKK